ncbi:MAG: TonB family protein [Candidatus Solibacter sp.]|nr:TonB family protein [Candidatus Solibacter sp.]
METVGPPADDAELHLLHEWGDPAETGRTRTAGVVSIILHVVVLVSLALVPPDVIAPRPPEQEMHRVVTPLIDPITEFTQPTPNKGKLAKELNIAALQPRPSIQAPRGAPSTSRPMAQTPAPVPMPPQPKPDPPPLPEPPKIEAVIKDAPKIDLPPSVNTVAPPPPTVAKPKLTLENVGGPPPPVRPEQSKIAIPSTSISDAIRQNTHPTAPGGGLMVGDPGAGSGGYGEGINLPPSPGVQGSALELKSDPMGVDFRPYLTQILATIRRNWYAVMPESVKLGRRGKVGLLFKILRTGKVDKVVFASNSGSDALDRAAVAAISASNPLPPLPPEFKGENIVLQLNFAYNLPKP